MRSHAAALLVLLSCGSAPEPGELEEVELDEASGLVRTPPTSAPCGTIPSGYGIVMSRSITSCNGRWSLVWYGGVDNHDAFLQLDGVIYTGLTIIPPMVASPVGKHALVVRANGDLQIIDENRDFAIWSAGTDGNNGAIAEITNDGRLRVVKGTQELWATATPWLPTAEKHVISQGFGFGTGKRLTSLNDRFQFRLGGDPAGFGSVRILDTSSGRNLFYQPLPRAAFIARMQHDGNFVVFDREDRPMWATGTGGNPNARLQMQDDGNLVVVSSSGTPRWASNTAATPAGANLVIDRSRSTYDATSGIVCAVENIGTASSSGLLRVRVRVKQYASNTSATVTGTFYSSQQVNQSVSKTQPRLFFLANPSPSGLNLDNAQVTCEVNWNENGYTVTESNYNDNSYVIVAHRGQACASPGGGSLDVDCFLSQQAAIADAIKFELPPASGQTAAQLVTWRNWKASLRADLRQVTTYYVRYLTENKYGGKLGTARDLQVTDVPNTRLDVPNLPANLSPTFSGVVTTLAQKDAWALYVKAVGLSLATELTRTVPWSIVGYDSESLRFLFDSRTTFGYFNASAFLPAGYRTQDTKGVIGGVTPISALKTRQWLVTSYLLEATPRDTIGALLGWARRLNHGAAYDLTYMVNATGYAGADPLYVMLLGRVTQDPQSIQNIGFAPYIYNTSGCHMTAQLFHEVLRTVNIPAGAKSGPSTHAVMHFPREAAYVSHGDSPYFSETFGFPPPEPELLLLDQAQYNRWLASTTMPEANIGASERELQIRAGSTRFLLDSHCADRAAKKTHAQSSVYAMFSPHYTVAELEGRNLWQKLDGTLDLNGGCTAVSTAIHNEQRGPCLAREPYAPIGCY